MTWMQPELEAVAGLVSKRTGLSFVNRMDNVELGIRRAMIKAHVRDPADYRKRIATDDSALDELINELTVGETYFFREPAHFELIQREVIPEIQQRRGFTHALRIWSAACASGEEAYSLAMLLEKMGLAWPIVSTDISRTALAKARQAIFSAWSLRGPSAQAALPYLTRVGDSYHLDEKIRRRVAFSYLNLGLDAYPSFAAGFWGMDLILCRNVLIYFDRVTIGKVANRLYQTLAEGGWLITASSDPPLWEHAPFEVINRDEGVFYRRTAAGSAKLEPPHFEPVSVATWELEPPEISIPEDAGSAEASPAPAVDDRLAQARDAFARGDYARVVEATPNFLDNASVAALHVRSLANLDAAAAEEANLRATVRHPLSAELHYLHAVLLLDLGKNEEASQALRRVLYLDRTLAVAHFTLGAVLSRRGDRAGACRAYRNARDLCAARPVKEAVALSDGEPAGRLAEIAGAELILLESSQGEP